MPEESALGPGRGVRHGPQNQDLEQLQLLAGSRRRGQEGKAAVRLEDLKDFLTLPEMTAVTVTGSVAVADFNALLEDVKAIHARVKAVAGIIQGRIR